MRERRNGRGYGIHLICTIVDVRFPAKVNLHIPMESPGAIQVWIE